MGLIQIRSKRGNFGSYKDLLLFMKDENLTEIEVETLFPYWDTENALFKNRTLTIEEVEKILKGDE